MKATTLLFTTVLFIAFAIGVSAQETEKTTVKTGGSKISTEPVEIEKTSKNSEKLLRKEKPETQTAKVFDEEPKIGLTSMKKSVSQNNLFVRQPTKKLIEPIKPQDDDDEYHKGEFYVGYSGALVVDEELGFEPGINASGVYYFHRYIGAKVDFSATFQDIGGGTHSLYNFTGGVQFKDSSKSKTIKPFFHTLVGVSRHEDKYDFAPRATSGETGLSTIFGGGLDIKVSDNIDIRAFQIDANPIFFSRDVTGFRRTYVNVRYGAGVVFNF